MPAAVDIGDIPCTPANNNIDLPEPAAMEVVEITPAPSETRVQVLIAASDLEHGKYT